MTTTLRRQVINLWDTKTFSPEIIETLDHQNALIKQYHEEESYIFLAHDCNIGCERSILRPSNPVASEFHRLTENIARLFETKVIRGFHYTRMTDSEVSQVMRQGVHVLTRQTLRDRVDSLPQVNAQAVKKIFADSPLNDPLQAQARLLKFWMTSHPLPVDHPSVENLLGRWGGEAVSFWAKDAEVISILEKTGKPRILELAVDLKNITACFAYSAANAAIATFANSHGYNVESKAFDFYTSAALSPNNILDIHTEGGAGFHSIGRNKCFDSPSISNGCQAM